MSALIRVGVGSVSEKRLKKSMLLRVLVVYSIRGVSGLGTLLAILLVGRYYSSAELASYSLFMFFFNLMTIFFLWGDAVTVVDKYNNDGDVPITTWLGHKALDGIVVSLMFFCALSSYGHWSYGLAGAVPVGFTALLAALLVMRKKNIAASLCFEFSRAVIPFLVMAAIILSQADMGFDALVIVAYSSFWFGMPFLFIYVKKKKLWSINLSLDLRGWLKIKQAGIPIVMPQIIIILVFQADRLFINYWGGTEELASYFAAQTLYTVVLVAVHSTFNLVIPETSKVAAVGQGDMRKSGRIMLMAQLGASMIIIPVGYFYLGFLGVDRVVAMQSMLLLMAGGILSACFGIGFPALQFCQRKSIYLKVVLAGMLLQFSVIAVSYSTFGLYAVALGFMVYNLSTSVLAALFWRKRSVAISPFSFVRL